MIIMRQFSSWERMHFQMQENKMPFFKKTRIYAICFFIISYFVLLKYGLVCWGLELNVKNVAIVSYVLCASLIFSIIFLASKTPEVSIFGVIIFSIVFYYFNNENCSWDESSGGASIVQIPIIFMGSSISLVGMGVYKLILFVAKR